MKLVLLLLFCFHFNTSWSQSDSLITTYTDYSKCQKGFKRRNGVRIWEPVFEWTQRYGYNVYGENKKGFWIAKKTYGHVGLLDLYGNEVISFNYDQLRPLTNGLYVAQKDGLWGLIDGEEKILVPYEYDWIGFNESYYHLRKDEKQGILSTDFKEVLPCVYDDIKGAEMHDLIDSPSYFRSTNLFIVKKDTLYGAFDSTNGVIVPTKYKSIQAIWADNHCMNSLVGFITYSGVWPKWEVSLLDSRGDEIEAPDSAYIRVNSFQFDSCGLNSASFGFVQNRNGTHAVTMDGKHHSKNYDKLFQFQARLVFIDEEGWGVLDRNLREIARYNKLLPSINQSYGEPRPSYYGMTSESYSAWNKNVETINWDDDLIYTIKTINPEVEDEWDREYTMGLRNYKTDQSIPPKYNEILLRRMEDDVFYWAIRDNGKEKDDKRLTLDVYDSNFKKIKTHKYFNPVDRLHDHRIPLVDRLTIVKNEDELYGGINMSGELVIPFEYEYHDRSGIRRELNYYILGKGYEAKGLFNAQGEELIPCKFKYITRSRTGCVIAQTEEFRTAFYDPNLELVFDKCHHYGMIENLDEYGKSSSSDLPYNESTFSHLLVNDGYVYLFEKGKLVKADDSRFKFTGDYLLLTKRLSIDKFGKAYHEDKTRKTRKSTLRELEYKNPFPETLPVVKSGNLYASYYWRAERDARGEAIGWRVYDSLNETEINDVLFDFPLVNDYLGTRIFKSKGLFGIIDENNKVVVPAEYDFAYVLNEAFTVNYDGQWFLYSLKNGLYKHSFHAIDRASKFRLNRARFVFHFDSVGIIDDDFNWLLPMTDTNTVIKTIDLVKLLGIEGFKDSDAAHAYKGIVFNGKPSSFYLQRNNRFLLEKAFLGSTGNLMMNVSIYPVGRYYKYASQMPVIQYSYRDYQTKIRRIPYYHSPFYYSETVQKKFEDDWNELSYREWGHSNVKRMNYRIVKGELVEVTLDDILKSNPAAQKILDDLIIKEITRAQPYGLDCANLEAFIKTFKEDFILTKYSIMFFSSSPDFSIKVSYGDLQDVLIDKSKFKR